MIGILYIITNSITEKVYIGKTYRTLNKRWTDHKKAAKRFGSRPLYSAMNRYGTDKFNISELGRYKSGELEVREIEAISNFNSYYGGYNQTRGGEGGVAARSLYKKINTQKKQVYSQTLNKEFESLSSCAQHLIDIGLATGTARSVSSCLTKACTGSRKTYKGHKFNYIMPV